MKKLLPLLLTAVFLTGCSSISENDWVQAPDNTMENKINTIVEPGSNGGKKDNNDSSVEPTTVEQVKTEFWPEPPRFKMKKFTVTKILEGDLIQVDGQEKVRLLGVSTKTPKDYKRVYLEVTEEFTIQYLSEQLLNKTVYLEQHPKFPRNPDGETVAYVWIGNAKKLSNINARMLENGMALAERIENVTIYDETFKKLENQANKSGIGFWKEQK